MPSIANQPALKRADWIAAAVLAAATLLVFGSGAARRGFYYDDTQWITTLGSASWATVWTAMRDYVPGRPLFVFWQYLVFKLFGTASLHLFQSFLDAVIASGFFLLLRRLRIPGPVALMAAALFSFWPVHGETHFWNTSIVGNLITAILAIAFLTLSIHPPQRWYWRLADFGSFAAALLTYDQLFAALAAVLALRIQRTRRYAAHLPHLVAVAFYFWLKARPTSGPSPALSSDTARYFWSNIAETLRIAVAGAWTGPVAGLYGRAQTSDWLLAAAVAAILTAWAIRMTADAPESSPLRPILWAGLAFFAAAYLPVWVWYPSPRHHFLPSLGLFTAFAAVIARLARDLRGRTAQTLLLVPLGAAVCFFAAAGLGENRAWEQAFQAKSQLFQELKPDLEGADLLILENFPSQLGPAYLIYPQDASYAPRMFFGDSLRLAPGFTGDISGVPAPGGWFLFTHIYYHGPENFQYIPARKPVVARFTGWDGTRLVYEKNTSQPVPYQILFTHETPAEGPFEVSRVTARRAGEDLLVDLDLRASQDAGSYLAVVPSLAEHDEFHPWAYRSEGHMAGAAPVLLSGPGPASSRRTLSLRLSSFPPAEQVRLDFYLVAPGKPPVRLGRAESPITL